MRHQAMPPTRAIHLLLIALLVAGCAPATAGQSDGSPTPSAATPEPTRRADPSSGPFSDPSGTPTPTLSEEKRPPAGEADMPTFLLPHGQWANVTGDGLRVRYMPGGLDEPFETTISAGTTLFLDASSPVQANGFQWFSIWHGAVIGADGLVHADGGGWVAGATEDGSETYIELTTESCPELPVGPETFARLSAWAKQHCTLGPLTGLTGMLDQPLHGPITPFTYEPQWLWWSGWFLTDPDEAGNNVLTEGWGFPVHFQPGAPTSTLRRGDLVTISGHLADPAADECRVIGRDDVPEPTTAMQRAFRDSCRVAFVVDDLDVIGHVELPTP